MDSRPDPGKRPVAAGRRRLTYRDAGVDLERGRRLVDLVRPLAASTRRPGVMDAVGAFGSLFELPAGYRRPVLVSGTDGVGTKLRLAAELGGHEGTGIDLVAMCANDVLCMGAEPLFFLDYFASGRLDERVAGAVLRGVAEGCRRAGAALIGGESAEMPGMYAGGDYDLAGFCVGVVERDRIIDGRAVAAGDALVGLASSGLHANGFSLVRRALAVTGSRFDERVGGRRLREVLLEPTRIYVASVLDLLDRVRVHGIAHVTGGGLVENLPRMLSEGTSAHLRSAAWPRDPIFDWLSETAGIGEDEMRRTFNCGLGMVVAVAREDLDTALRRLEAHGEGAFPVGEVRAAKGPPAVVFE